MVSLRLPLHWFPPFYRILKEGCWESQDWKRSFLQSTFRYILNRIMLTSSEFYWDPYGPTKMRAAITRGCVGGYSDPSHGSFISSDEVLLLFKMARMRLLWAMMLRSELLSWEVALEIFLTPLLDHLVAVMKCSCSILLLPKWLGWGWSESMLPPKFFRIMMVAYGHFWILCWFNYFPWLMKFGSASSFGFDDGFLTKGHFEAIPSSFMIVCNSFTSSLSVLSFAVDFDLLIWSILLFWGLGRSFCHFLWIALLLDVWSRAELLQLLFIGFSWCCCLEYGTYRASLSDFFLNCYYVPSFCCKKEVPLLQQFVLSSKVLDLVFSILGWRWFAIAEIQILPTLWAYLILVYTYYWIWKGVDEGSFLMLLLQWVISLVANLLFGLKTQEVLCSYWSWRTITQTYWNSTVRLAYVMCYTRS